MSERDLEEMIERAFADLGAFPPTDEGIEQMRALGEIMTLEAAQAVLKAPNPYLQ